MQRVGNFSVGLLSMQRIDSRVVINAKVVASFGYRFVFLTKISSRKGFRGMKREYPKSYTRHNKCLTDFFVKQFQFPNKMPLDANWFIRSDTPQKDRITLTYVPHHINTTSPLLTTSTLHNLFSHINSTSHLLTHQHYITSPRHINTTPLFTSPRHINNTSPLLTHHHLSSPHQHCITSPHLATSQIQVTYHTRDTDRLDPWQSEAVENR